MSRPAQKEGPAPPQHGDSLICRGNRCERRLQAFQHFAGHGITLFRAVHGYRADAGVGGGFYEHVQ